MSASRPGSASGCAPWTGIYDTGDHFIINLEECIDCTMSDPVYPVDAIRPDFQLPEEMEHFKTKAAEFDYSGLEPGKLNV
jgi:Fe-S-cluster-containing hydrogenase component 2